MKKKIYSITALLFGSLVCLGQDLNQSVSVSNDYENRVSDHLKITPEMTVPDSLKSFNLNFDYSVFDQPYIGTYEFNPYGINMIPEAMGNRSSRLYADIAAGYSFAPEAHVVYNPVRRSNASVAVFADMDGYNGKYKTGYRGYDFSERVGVVSNFSSEKYSFRAGIGFDGLQVSDRNLTTSVSGRNAASGVSAFARITSRSGEGVPMKYDYLLKFSHLADKSVTDNGFSFDVRMEPQITGKAVVKVDASLNYLYLDGAAKGQYASMILHPTIEYPLWRFRLRGGFRLGSAGKLTFRPDLQVQMDVLKDCLHAYASLEGGDEVRSYSSMMAGNHHLNADALAALDAGKALKYTRLLYDARAGIRGGIRSAFGYDLSLGSVSYRDAPFYGFASRLCYSDFKAVNLKASVMLRSKFVDVSASAQTFGNVSGLAEDVYSLPGLISDIQVFGKLSDRISLSGYMHYTAKRGAVFGTVGVTVPSMCNLGLRADYSFSSRLVFWARMDNILDDALRQVPDYASKGFNFLLGASLKL